MTVADPWCERQSSLQGLGPITRLPFSLLWFHPSHGGHLFHVLHVVEPVSDVASCSCRWQCNLSERKQGIDRSPGKETCGASLNLGAECTISHACIAYGEKRLWIWIVKLARLLSTDILCILPPLRLFHLIKLE